MIVQAKVLLSAIATAAIALAAPACTRAETPDPDPDPGRAQHGQTNQTGQENQENQVPGRTPTPGAGRRAAPANLTTDTDSRSLATAAERVAFVTRYIPARATPLDAEFTIRYRDNSGGLVPGPSDWSIQAVLAVSPGDLPAWLAGWKPCGEAAPDTSWSRPLVTRRDEWRVTSQPLCYLTRGGHLWVHEPEGLLLYRSVSDPAMR